jgi:hypothetical protein
MLQQLSTSSHIYALQADSNNDECRSLYNGSEKKKKSDLSIKIDAHNKQKRRNLHKDMFLSLEWQRKIQDEQRCWSDT